MSDVQVQTIDLPSAVKIDRQLGERAVWVAFVGFFVDVYELYLPVLILAPAYIYFKPSHFISPVLDSFILAASLLGRPVGALFFGYFADRLGRKRIAEITMVGAGVSVFFTALLPGYQSIGIFAIILLIVLRFLSGFFVGGQYTGSVTLAMESCPSGKRGLYGGFIGASSNLSFIVMSILGLALFAVMPPADLDSPYVQWGWRIPFIIGGVLAFAFCAYVIRDLQESPLWLAGGGKHGFSKLFSGVQIGKLVQGFILMNGLWLTYLVPAAMVPGLLRNTIHLRSQEITAIMLVASAVTFFGFLLGGAISDRIGRRAAFIWQALVSGVVGFIFICWLSNLTNSQVFLAGTLVTVAFFLVGMVWGSGPHSYLNERFHTGNRSAGYGIAFSFAIVLPSFFGVYERWLGVLAPGRYAPAILLAIGALIVLVAAVAGPETRTTNNLDG